jgi:hypothetical protein
MVECREQEIVCKMYVVEMNEEHTMWANENKFIGECTRHEICMLQREEWFVRK